MSKRPGRPPLFDVPVTARIYVHVTPAQRTDLQRVASDNKTDVAGIIRDAVNEYVADYRDRKPFRRRKR
jgi:hypothetical protein